MCGLNTNEISFLHPLTLCKLFFSILCLGVCACSSFLVLPSTLSLSRLSNPFFSSPLALVPSLKYPWMVSLSALLPQCLSCFVVQGSGWRWSWGTAKLRSLLWRVSQMLNPSTVWIPGAPLLRCEVRRCWAASRFLWTLLFQRRTRRSALALNCWQPTASARRRQSTLERLGPSLPRLNPRRITPWACLLPHLGTVDTIPRPCPTRASWLSLWSQTSIQIQKCFLMVNINKYLVSTALVAHPMLLWAHRLLIERLTA